MKKKILVLFSVIALLCSGCGVSISVDTSNYNTSLPSTIDEGLNDKTSDIVGGWYGKNGSYACIYYMYSNGTGEVIGFKHDDGEVVGFEHDSKTVYSRFQYNYHPKTGLLTVDYSYNNGFSHLSSSYTLSFSDDGNTLTSVSDETDVFTRIE